MSLRNIDRTDLEMLHIVQDCEDKDGVVASQDVAEYLGLGKKNGRSPAGRVSTRLSWMTRYGQLERLDSRLFGRPRNEAIWRLTPFGRDLLRGGDLPARLQHELADSSAAGRRVAIIRELAYGAASDSMYTTLRRQWQHDQELRRRGGI